MKYFVAILTVAVLFMFSIEQAQSAKRVTNKMMAGAGLSYNIPTGDLADGVEGSLGFAGNFMYKFSSNMAGNVSVGYIKWSFEQDTDLDFATIPILIGGRYFFSEAGTQPYLGLDIGMYNHSVEVEFLGSSRSDSESYFGWSVLGGALIPINSGVFVNAFASYTSVDSEISADLTYFSINAGVMFAID